VGSSGGGVCLEPPQDTIAPIQGCTPEEPEVPEIPVRIALHETFRSQAGVRQTGNNTGPEIDAYLASVGLGPGYAWCGAFVAWGYLKHDVPIPNGAAWSPSWFPQSKTIPKEQGQQSDVFGIHFQSLGRIAHVGVLAEDFDNGNNLIKSYEGNTNDTGSRTGDGVYKKYRSKNQISKIANWIE